MEAIIILTFVIGYLFIAFEHPLHLDKTIPALIMAALCWAGLSVGFFNGWLGVVDSHNHVFSLANNNFDEAQHGFESVLLHHLGKTAEILIFLIGAMTIVEIIDLHYGFELIKKWVSTKNKRKLLWILTALAFVLSAIIDNLTATIILVTLTAKLINDRRTKLFYIGMIVIGANAGGAWSPIGDVTTTMLWIGKKTSAMGLAEYVVLPSIVCYLLPTFIASYLPIFKGRLNDSSLENTREDSDASLEKLSSRTMLFLGMGAIVFVPIFKTLTHLPPYVGMMLSLGVVWLISEFIHPEEDFTEERKHLYSPHLALSRIEMSSILFFLGILMAVAALESMSYKTIMVNGSEQQVGTLRYLAEVLNEHVPSRSLVVMLLGAFSAVIDNVPLVAASMGMYDYELDHPVWHFIAYAAGTGGSLLIIGSAAGVAAMGIEKIDFLWYLKKIAWLALIGYLAGCLVFVLMHGAKI